jgi:hypothetical protein
MAPRQDTGHFRTIFGTGKPSRLTWTE